MALNDRIPIYNLNFKKRIPLPDVIIIIPNNADIEKQFN
jgi:hypothetical protein